MTYNFDSFPNRQQSDSIKWRYFAPDVLPMWVADMDFLSPPAVIDALRARAEHGVFGYPTELGELKGAIVDWVGERHGWAIHSEWLVLLPGVVVGFNLAAHATGQPGDGILIQTPVYPPFLEAPVVSRRELRNAPLVQAAAGCYEIDLDAFERAVAGRPSLFLLCNPHNPVGRVFTQTELEGMAERCLRHGVTVCSDEIHADLVYSGQRHLPIAALSDEIAQQTITLMAPSKTFNIAGLGSSFAIIPNPELRRTFKNARQGLVGHPNLMGQMAALAAYQHGGGWLDDLLPYLEANRDWLAQAVVERLPGVHMASPEGTYLAWLDCRALGLPQSPCEFFLKEAHVGLVDGKDFGEGGAGFVRLNFGCPRAILVEAVSRMQAALQGR
jgi:cystathionine beta-lyase